MSDGPYQLTPSNLKEIGQGGDQNETPHLVTAIEDATSMLISPFKARTPQK